MEDKINTDASPVHADVRRRRFHTVILTFAFGWGVILLASYMAKEQPLSSDDAGMIVFLALMVGALIGWAIRRLVEDA